MKRLGRVLLGVLALIVAIVVVGPFLVPVPDLEGTVDPRELAFPDSEFVDVNGVAIHVRPAGFDGVDDHDVAYLLLHGFAASTYTWREVVEPLAARRPVIVYDRPAFGLTERPIQWDVWNPYGGDAQVDIALALLDHYHVERAVVIGNSAGGRVAAEIAAAAPERIAGLVLVSPAIGSDGGPPGWVKWLLDTPQAHRLGPLLIRRFRDSGNDLGRLAWHDPSRLTEENWAGYRLPLQAHDWDRALWFFMSSLREEQDLAGVVADLVAPVVIVTGDDDRVVPTASSVRLGDTTGRNVVVFEACGHVPHEECPDAFLDALFDFEAL